ncbi:hypothetical protein NADFUDRAFT_39401 [Nadsonia fulvescens var. elongata DSM 6958]|uniref:Zn(2)-C6 fungal-type domain-containing protein n=1 Tax=Nadsonia fulvescens var. elongata DSM 6958 TaxID=857566 RepID=A0A1E3PRX8_9ASCO|nr:hypothetical protein NADFUDRAFT_39401 [Nadsonia fulvescens var. elongata DSM 6958]
MTRQSTSTKPIKRRSRNGCHNCKAHKIKCDEIKPICGTCQRTNTSCDYSLKLSWGGRPVRNKRKVSHEQNNSSGSWNINTSGFSDDSPPTSTPNPISDESTLGFISYQPPQPKSKARSKTSKKTNQTLIQNVTLNSAFSLPVALPILSHTSPLASLSNKAVLQKISNIDRVFQPVPSQLPVKPEGFIQEFSIKDTLINDNTKKRPINQVPSPNGSTKRIKKQHSPDYNFDQETLNLPSQNQLIEENWLSKGANSAFNTLDQSPLGNNNASVAANSTYEIPSDHNDSTFIFPDLTLSKTSHLPHTKSAEEMLAYDLAHDDFDSLTANDKITNCDDHNNTNLDLDISPKSDLLSFLTGFDTPGLNSIVTDDPFAKDFDIINELYPSENNYQNQLSYLPLKYQVRSSPSDFFPYDSASNSSGSDDGDRSSVSESYNNSQLSIQNNGFSEIPRSLDLLPDILLQVPLYRELFHLYVHSLAQILVPVPNVYPDNPFKILLPRMALRTPHLLCLLVAFSASYRSKMLLQPEPCELIQQLLSRTYDGLAKSFEDTDEAYSDATLCTVILLSSFEVLSPKTDEVWKTHLQGAKDIVLARKKLTPNYIDKYFTEINSTESKIELLDDQVWLEPTGLTSSTQSSSLFYGQKIFNPASPKLETIRPMVKNEDEVSYFLLRWLAYLDVLSAMCSYKSTTTSLEGCGDPYNVSKIWNTGCMSLEQYKKKLKQKKQRLHQTGDYSNDTFDSINSILRLDNEQPLGRDIDALLGFDISMVPIFSRISEMAHERRNLPPGHQPSPDFFNQANELREILLECHSSRREIPQIPREGNLFDLFTELEYSSGGATSRSSPLASNSPELYLQNSEGSSNFYWHQLIATNSAFCYAGLVHLYRRVYHLKREDPLVQDAVKNITHFLINSIADTSSTSACVSFPLLTASFEIMDEETRKWYEQRLYNHSISGYFRAERIVQIVKKVWEEDGARSWWEIAEENECEIFMG